MKLNEKNAKFAVVKTAFHEGGTISFHNSLTSASKIARKYTGTDCTCGCCDIVPITKEAMKEMCRENPHFEYDESKLYSNLPEYEPEMSYWRICK